MTAIESNTLNVFWQHHIAQWQASGLSQAGYCRQQALSAHQLSYWKRKLQTPCQSL
ncbi:IS66 family insertion sequence element accessory protein TnpA, partial [Methylicorpusculum sp.]